jgi:uncharacterized protein involved in high-affinity Fe2+ transport
VFNRWAGPLITTLILVGVAAILLLNLNTSPPRRTPEPRAPSSGGSECPIGDEAIKNHMQIAAVWLPAIQMDGMPSMSSDIIHIEADIHATEGNPNGFALGEFVPYLKVKYAIAPASGGAPIHQGEMVPMVASDGLHYGASVSMPRAGQFRLTYDIEPPTATLGRHSDPVTGVAPWWKPFQVSFDWDFKPDCR